MADTTDTWHRKNEGISHDSRRAALASVLALTAVLMLVALPAAHSAWVYWAASSAALAGVLVLFVAGERAWDRMVEGARSVGVIAPHRRSVRASRTKAVKTHTLGIKKPSRPSSTPL